MSESGRNGPPSLNHRTIFNFGEDEFVVLNLHFSAGHRGQVIAAAEEVASEFEEDNGFRVSVDFVAEGDGVFSSFLADFAVLGEENVEGLLEGEIADFGWGEDEVFEVFGFVAGREVRGEGALAAVGGGRAGGGA